MTFPDGKTVTVTAGSNGEFSISSAPGQGSGPVTVKMTDRAGNTTGAKVITKYVDTTPPAAPAITSTQQNGDGTLTVTGTAEPNTTVTVTFPDGSSVVVAADANGVFSATSAAKMASGTVTVVAKDGAANASPSSAQPVVTDTTGPTVTIILPSGPVGQSFTILLEFSEPVGGLDLTDLTVKNGTATGLRQVSGAAFQAYAPGSAPAEPVQKAAAAPTVYEVDVTADPSIPEGEGVEVTVRQAAVSDAYGNGNAASAPVMVTTDMVAPVVTLSHPESIVTGPFSLSIAATEEITGLELSDFALANATLANLAGSGAAYTVQVTPVLGTVVSVTLPAGAVTDLAGNPTAEASAFSVQAGSPETAFAERRDDIIDTVQGEAKRRLGNDMSANSGMMNSARDRFVEGQQTPGQTTRDMPLDVSGAAELGWGTLETSGTFFGQKNLSSGMTRTVMGQFDISKDETSSLSAQVSGRVTYEKALSDRTVLGYFLGGSLNKGEISGAFSGDSSGLGVVAGGYGLTRLSENIFADAYAGVGYSRTQLTFSDPVLALDGTYGAWSTYAGASVTGSWDAGNGVELRPNLAIDYGRTDIGVVGMTASAYGLTSVVNQDFGAVSVLELSLTPEVIVPLAIGEGQASLSVAPSLICRYETGRTSTEECGGGIGLALQSTSADGLKRFGIGVNYQGTGSSQQTSAELGFEMQF